MDSETIRTTISPVFLMCSLSFSVGIGFGIVLGLLEQTLITWSIWIGTSTGIIFFIWYEFRYLKRGRKI